MSPEIVMTETGGSETHRAEARYLAKTAHEMLAAYDRDRPGDFQQVIALAQLHTGLALLDSLDEIRQALTVIATASR